MSTSAYTLISSDSDGLGTTAGTDAADRDEVLGAEFVAVYEAVKRNEYKEFLQVISPWEREHLLLNV